MGLLNLYFVKRTDHADYDEYDSYVVAAVSEEGALAMHPRCGWGGGWTTPENVVAKLLGVALPSIEGGIICSSFNAG